MPKPARWLICSILDVDFISDVPVMLMQMVDGQSMEEWLTDRRVPPKQAVELICKIALALAEAHEKGIAHLNVKPSNILIAQNGSPILSDFTLPKSSSEFRSRRFIVPSFLAPEQLVTGTIANPFLCDVYSLGVVLYEILAGRRAFHGTGEYVAFQIQHDPPRRIRDYRADVSIELEAICLRAMSKSPSRRFGSMVEFFEAMTGWLGAE